MIDPKVVGGGVAVVAIGGGTGYAISNATSSNGEADDSSKTKGPTERELFEKKITDAGFVLLTTNETDVSNKSGDHWTKWNQIVAKVDANASSDDQKLEKIKKLQKQCSGYREDSQLQEAIKNCTELVTLKTRAASAKFGLVALKTEENEKTADQTKWEAKKTNYTTASFGTLNDWQAVATKCKELEAKTHLESDFNQTYWTNYLKVCMDDQGTNKTKYDEAMQKSYWTAVKEVTTTQPVA